MAEMKKLKLVKGLSKDQKSYFLFGFTMWGNKFPFDSETHRQKLWLKHREELMALVYQGNGTFEDRYAANPNQLRPKEWFVREAPEQKAILNGAVLIRIDPNNGHHIWDKSPLEESDLEFLSRLGLLNAQDKAKISTESFRKEEIRDIRYRKYVMEETLNKNKSEEAI